MVFLLVTMVFTVSAFAQPGRMMGEGGRGMERLEKYKKFRMIEALDLTEEAAVRFMAQYNTHKDNMRAYMKERMEIIDRLEQSLTSKDGSKEFENLFSLLEENEQKMFNERKRFHEEVKKTLSPEQAAKYFVFDRNFNRELRNVMEDMRRERRRK